jgi:hypothetical protein
MLTARRLRGVGEGPDEVRVGTTYELRYILNVHASFQQVSDTRATKRVGCNAIAQSYLLTAFRQFAVDPGALDRSAPLLPEKQAAGRLVRRVFHVEPHELDRLAGKQDSPFLFARAQSECRSAFRSGLEVVSNEPACFRNGAASAVEDRYDRIELSLPRVRSGKSHQQQTFGDSRDGFYQHTATIGQNDESPFKGKNSYDRASSTPASRRRLFPRFGNLIE